jgi:ribosomal protein RSM22 (predicted rRNA methylase)
MNKKQRLKNHKIFVLATMLADELETETQSGEAKQIHELSRKLQHLLDPVVDKVFNASKLVNKTTYIQDMQNKLDTIIRKNYQMDTS